MLWLQNKHFKSNEKNRANLRFLKWEYIKSKGKGDGMNKKRKVGILLILIGIGIPLVLFFFQEDGYLGFKNPAVKDIERKLNPREIDAIEKERERRKSLMPEGERSLYDKWMEMELEKDYWKKEKWTIRIETYLIPYRYSIGIGIILILIGIGMIIFSSSPKEAKTKKSN